MTVNALLLKNVCTRSVSHRQARSGRSECSYFPFQEADSPPLHGTEQSKKGKLFPGLSLLLDAYEETRSQPSKTSYPGPSIRKAVPTSDKEQLESIDIYQSVGWHQASKTIAHIYRELIMARHCPICPHILSLEKAMAPHSSTLAWKIPWMEEPGGLQSMGSPRVGHD